jgi:hypothetical protein
MAFEQVRSRPATCRSVVLRISRGRSHQIGGRPWREVQPGFERIVTEQRTDGAYGGSWDPAGDWSREGGRVFATAIAVLTLETPYAYTRLVR